MRKPTIVKRMEIYQLMEEYLKYLLRTGQRDLFLSPNAKTTSEAISQFKFKAKPMKEVLFAWKGKNLSWQRAYNQCSRFNKEMKEWRFAIFLLMRTQEGLLIQKEVKENE